MANHTKEYIADWRAKNRQKYNSYFIKYRQDPLFNKKNRARCALNRAIRNGRIERGICIVSKCSSVGEGHHPDYDKPLDVIWICKKHHEQLHHKSS